MTWEALAAIAGVAAFVMSAVALWRQHRSDQRQQRLDRRLVEIEEARHAAEIDQSRTADVIVTGTRHHSVSGSHYRLTLHNHGGGEAREVTVAAVYAVAQGLDITRHLHRQGLPLPALAPKADFLMTMQSFAEVYGPFDFTVCWVDDARPNGFERTVRVNP